YAGAFDEVPGDRGGRATRSPESAVGARAIDGASCSDSEEGERPLTLRAEGAQEPAASIEDEDEPFVSCSDGRRDEYDVFGEHNLARGPERFRKGERGPEGRLDPIGR